MSASAPLTTVLVALALLALPACNEAGGQAKTEHKPDRPVLVTQVRYVPLSPERSVADILSPRFAASDP